MCVRGKALFIIRVNVDSAGRGLGAGEPVGKDRHVRDYLDHYSS